MNIVFIDIKPTLLYNKRINNNVLNKGSEFIMIKNKIGVFDSGIGGVTVLRELLQLLPDENYIYYSDSINNPYGDKSDEEIFEICDNIVEQLIKECKIIVIACNTASAKAADKLRIKYPNTPILAIEPAYKTVHDYAYEKPTLIMATKGTIESEKFHNLYNKYDNHKTFLLPCVGLANIIEEGDKSKIQKYLQEVLSEYSGKVQNVVLGCTHYPLIKKEIEQVLGKVDFFEGSKGLAKNVKRVLEENNLLSQNLIEQAENPNNYRSIEFENIQFLDSSNSEFKKDRFYEYLI